MPIVLISDSLLQRATMKDGRLLRDSMLCGFCVRMTNGQGRGLASRQRRGQAIAHDVGMPPSLTLTPLARAILERPCAGLGCIGITSN